MNSHLRGKWLGASFLSISTCQRLHPYFIDFQKQDIGLQGRAHSTLRKPSKQNIMFSVAKAYLTTNAMSVRSFFPPYVSLSESKIPSLSSIDFATSGLSHRALLCPHWNSWKVFVKFWDITLDLRILEGPWPDEKKMQHQQ